MIRITCQPGVQPPVRMAVILLVVNLVLMWHNGVLGGPQVTVATTFRTNYKGVVLTNSSREVAEFFKAEERMVRERLGQLEEHLEYQGDRVTVLVLNKSKIDPQYEVYWNVTKHVQCHWVPTSHCTPYGNVDLRSVKACHDIIPQGSSGFCVCPDGQFIGIPCQGFTSSPFQCARLCKTATTVVYPTHRELLKRYPPKPPVVRPKGVIITFARTSNAYIYHKTLANFEATFNKRYHYPYQVYFDPGDVVTEAYRDMIHSAVSAPVTFTNIDPGHWDIPGHINMTQIDLSKNFPNNNLYFRQVSRFFSGFFYVQKEITRYDWFWRLNEDVVYLCDVYFDPFLLMEKEKKVYGYSIMLSEFMDTVPTLYNETAKYAREKRIKPEWLPWLEEGGVYTGCHFWSAMTIGSLNWFRNSKYTDYFRHLDAAGGFFYERWADAPVHTLGLSLHANLSSIYYFESLAYVHTGIFHLPQDNSTCTAHPVPDPSYPGSNTDLSSCTGLFAHLANLPAST